MYKYNMMNKENIDNRWQQRFINFNKAFQQLERFIQEEELNEMEKQGLIKAFEYTYELAWKTLQDLLKDKGYADILGPRPVIEQSFQDGYIIDGKAWMRMHKSRNLTSHTYDEEAAKEIIEDIRKVYFFLLREIHIRLEEEKMR
ncbi:MAG: nucleotidyltransferase substrate binding protein [Bacteroidales bacterium]|nr:nucleotidyltransferase substrate binding protein [Bacteroidales bacterium]MCF6341444.1 nucleotidyltransferase substrate binding protein [Bacteroidales bacterium]